MASSLPRSLRTGGGPSGAAAGCGAGGGVSANGLGLHQVRAEAVFVPLERRVDLHPGDRFEILRHERVRAWPPHEGPARRWGRSIDYGVETCIPVKYT